MGNLYEKTYIVGEVDYRVIAFDRPILYGTNIGLRYPSFSTSEPSLTVNYDQNENVLWLYVSNSDAINWNGCRLRLEQKTTIITVECWRNNVTGYFSGCKIIKHDIVPITKSYAMK